MLSMFDDELKTIDKTIGSCANADILASAPEAAGVRVWHLMSRGWGSKDGVTAAEGRSCYLSSRRFLQSFPFEQGFQPSGTLTVTSTCELFHERILEHWRLPPGLQMI